MKEVDLPTAIDIGPLYQEYLAERMAEALAEQQQKEAAAPPSPKESWTMAALFSLGSLIPLVYGVPAKLVLAMGAVTWLLCVFSFELRHVNRFFTCVLLTTILYNIAIRLN